MPPNRITCPECDAEVISPDGYEAGQTVLCPKCEAYFTAGHSVRVGGGGGGPPPPPPAAHDDPPPRKRFPIGTVLLGVVLVGLIGGGVFAIITYRNQQAEERDRQEALAAEAEAKRAAQSKGGPGGPGGPPRKATPKPVPNLGPRNADTVREVGSVITDISGNSPRPTAAETKQRVAALRGQLVGTWRAKPEKPGDPPPRVIEYRADGTYKDETTGAGGRVLEGTWEATDVLGKKGLKVTRTGGGPATVRVTLEGDELIHDADTPGATTVLAKE